KGAARQPASSETERWAAQRGARPKRSDERSGPTRGVSIGRTSRSAPSATVAADDGCRAAPYRADERDQAGDQREPEHELLVDAGAERRDHGGAEAEAEQPVDDQRRRG